jgi:hypothetical protein
MKPAVFLPVITDQEEAAGARKGPIESPLERLNPPDNILLGRRERTVCKREGSEVQERNSHPQNTRRKLLHAFAGLPGELLDAASKTAPHRTFRGIVCNRIGRRRNKGRQAETLTD